MTKKYIDTTDNYPAKTVATTLTLPINTDISNRYTVTGLNTALTVSNPTGTPVDGQSLLIRIKDAGVAKGLTWDTQYRASSDLALPTTTILSKTLYLGFQYNSADTKWDLLALLNNI